MEITYIGEAKYVKGFAECHCTGGRCKPIVDFHMLGMGDNKYKKGQRVPICRNCSGIVTGEYTIGETHGN